jgi:hypothetical protein
MISNIVVRIWYMVGGGEKFLQILHIFLNTLTQQATGSRIDRRLQVIESVLYQPNHTNDDDLLLSPLETFAFSSFALERREFDQTHSVTSAAQHSFAAVKKPDPGAIARQASPASAFELSSHFIPVTYTVEEAVPVIICNEICEL